MKSSCKNKKILNWNIERSPQKEKNMNILEGFHTFSKTLCIQCVSLEILELGLSLWVEVIFLAVYIF